jgi:hypothetical protein
MDHHGKEIGYSIAESVELPTCPPFQKCVRARVSVCFLYRQTKNGTLKVYMRGKNKAGGRVIDWVTDLKSAELWLRTEELITCAHAKIASDLVAATEAKKHGTFSHRHHQKSTSERCDVCREKKTGVFATLSDCAVCKNGACSRCCIKKRVLGPANNFKQIRKEVFCKKCVQLIHDAPLRDLNATESLHRLALRCISNESSFSSSFISQRSMLSSSASSTKGSPKNSTSLRSPRTRGSAPRSHRSSSDQQPRSERNGYHYHSQRYSHQNQPNHKPLPASSTIISSSAPVPLVLYEVDEIHEGHLGNVLSKNASSDYTNSTGIVTSELSYNENSCPNSQVTTSLEIPMEIVLNSNVSPSSNSNGSTEVSYVDCTQPEFSYRPSENYTPENMMTKMIEMNLMAERARKLVQENDRLARMVSQGSN